MSAVRAVRGRIGAIPWIMFLLAAVLDAMGTIDYVGEAVADLASPLLVALLLCFIGAVGFIAAMAVSSTIVEVSPFSTNGALVLANARGVDRDAFFRRLVTYGALVTAVAPVVLWLMFMVVLG